MSNIADPASGSLVSIEDELRRRIQELELALGNGSDAVNYSPFFISVDDALSFKVGFDEREFDAAGEPVRALVQNGWSEIRFRFDRSIPASFHLIFEGGDIGRASGLTAWVDYIVTPLQVAGAEDDSFSLHGLLPAVQARRGAVLTLIDDRPAGVSPVLRIRGVRIDPIGPSTPQGLPAGGSAAQPVPRSGVRGPARARK